MRSASACGAADAACSQVDATDRRANFRFQSGRLARSPSQPAFGWRRCARAGKIERSHSRNQTVSSNHRNRNVYRCLAVSAVIGAGVVAATTGAWLLAQEAVPTFHAKVDLVVLTFTVTDSKGKYVNGLKPSDFRITEDGIPQKLSTFAEGDRPAMEVGENGVLKPSVGADHFSRGDSHRVTRRSNPPIRLRERAFSFCSIPATSCITGSCMRRMRSAILSGDSTKPIPSPCTLSAGTFRGLPSYRADHLNAISGLRTAVAGDDTGAL